jgi:hypothetical protein
MSHSSHLHVWIKDMEIVLSPADRLVRTMKLCADQHADDQASADSSIGRPHRFLQSENLLRRHIYKEASRGSPSQTIPS